MAVGGLFVVLFMAVYYQTSGVIADLALVLNVILIMGALAAFRATLTLPGIAGIVLTIGMAVDANVLIFERIREELRLGKTAGSARSTPATARRSSPSSTPTSPPSSRRRCCGSSAPAPSRASPSR